MNEQQQIFTPEQFRAQAVELSQAVAELQRRDAQSIDPHDPFHNETEFHGYQPDYAEIVPQIRIPGCRIPLRANSREKRRIRRYYNIVGGFMLGHMLVINMLAMGIESLALLLLRVVDSMSSSSLPDNYNEIAHNYFVDSSSMLALNLLTYGIVNILVFWLGCRTTKLQTANFFRTRNFNAGLAIGYVGIGLFIQLATGYAATWLTDLFESAGITLYSPDRSPDTELKSILMSGIYSVIIAPVTEELLMRGFVLKNLSRVSQRFGIFMSAFLFGIWHGNVAQFILAFFGGLFFGYIAVKHDSLIPSIICHMVINSFAEFFMLCEDFGWSVAEYAGNCIYLLLALAGIVLLVRMFLVERFPKSTPHQAERGLRQAIASPLMVATVVCYIALAVTFIIRATE